MNAIKVAHDHLAHKRDQLDRLAQVRAAERECTRLEAQLAREKQFNRKVEVNRALRESSVLLARLRA